jgi:hypothetical protein
MTNTSFTVSLLGNYHIKKEKLTTFNTLQTKIDLVSSQ